jgi:ATP-dependent Clp protease ATP-binding subunit ClpA
MDRNKMISSELEQYIAAASSYARTFQGPATSLMHILLAVLDDAELQAVLSVCNINYLDLRQEAVEAIAERMAAARPVSELDQQQDERRVDGLSALSLYALQAAQHKATARGSASVGVLDFVAAVIEVHDNGSFDFEARIVLTKAGLTVGNFAKARKACIGRPPFSALGTQPARHPSSLETVLPALHRVEPRLAEPPPAKNVGLGASLPFCTDLTELARQGKLDRSHGRSDVLEKLLIVLGRRKKRNAVLIGDPGVGKTSVAEELAYLIVEGGGGPKLDGAIVLSLDMGALIGGTKYRGELEERVNDLVSLLSNDPRLILFIDEIHVLGSVAHSASAAADILKPALASGAIRCVGATTLSEYGKFFEANGAMSRRFAPIYVFEPTRSEALDILKAAAPVYAEFHKVTYPEWAIEMALDLSIKHIPERRLPDKAIELIDDVGSRAALSGGIVTRQGVLDCVSAKTGRLVGREAMMSALATLSSESVEIAKATMRNALVAPSSGEFAVIAVVGPEEVDKEKPVKDAAKAIGRGYEMLDMAEFADHAAAAGLLGAPPGYVGYDNGGRLYDVVKRSPGCLLHLRNISQAHPAALSIIEECSRQGYVQDRTGRKTGLGGIQLVVSMDSENGRASIGFGSSKAQVSAYGVTVVDEADTLVTLKGDASDGALELTKNGLAVLIASAEAAGVHMALGSNVAEHIVKLMRSCNNSHARTFSRLVRVPVLDYLVSSTEDFIVESVDDGIRIREHEAV